MKTERHENEKLRILNVSQIVNLNQTENPGKQLAQIQESWNNDERLLRRLVAQRMQSILYAKLNTARG